jgi:hypothetical protein
MLSEQQARAFAVSPCERKMLWSAGMGAEPTPSAWQRVKLQKRQAEPVYVSAVRYIVEQSDLAVKPPMEVSKLLDPPTYQSAA